MTDNLLFALSSYGSLNFDAFERILQLLYTQEVGQIPDNLSFSEIRNNTLHSLEELSHCEIDYEKRKVNICPPTLILLPQYGLPKAILTGARTPTMIAKCHEFIKTNKSDIYIRLTRQSSSECIAPYLVSFETVNFDLLGKMADVIGVKFSFAAPASWLLLNYSAGLADVKSKLNFITMHDFSWKKRIFNHQLLHFSDSMYGITNSIYLAEYEKKFTLEKIHILWNNGRAAEVDRNWGRYIILTEKRRNVILYDYKRYVLAVPVTVPFPKLLSRVAVLCTGLMPSRIFSPDRFISNNEFYAYQSVAPKIAIEIARKLGQELIGRMVLVPREYLYE